MESLNHMAIDLADEAIDFADELRVGVVELDNGATVLDFGVEHRGGIEAGLLLAELQTAGLATVGSRVASVAGAPRLHVDLSTDHPGLALLCSQKAGWELSADGFEGLGSGPARALVAEEPEFEVLSYADAFDLAVLSIEADRLPTATLAERVAERAGVDPGGLYLPTYRTASVAGSVATAARAAELAAFRLFELGYDPGNLVSVAGSAPVAPVGDDEATAMARTNDALAYGSQVHLVVEEPFDRFDELPSSATDVYGEPFEAVFDEADWDFYD
ncbi:MAG: methenyltetrahydromethanopterin cyclohydrolase, partial [Halobacteriaceae archaeon]